MRILTASLLVLIIGAMVFFSQAFNKETASSTQLAQLRSNCLQCHDAPPPYPNVTFVHDKHITLECSVCHRQVSGLSTVENTHSIFQWAGLGAVALGLIGILANFTVMKTRKGKR
jgi:hypothetical protein